MSDFVEITKNVAVQVNHREDSLFDAAVITCWYPGFDKWKVEEDYVKAESGLSGMEVYGYIEYQVKPIYLN